MERELGKLEGVIESILAGKVCRQLLAVKFSESEENLPLVSHQEVLEIMKNRPRFGGFGRSQFRYRRSEKKF